MLLCAPQTAYTKCFQLAGGSEHAHTASDDEEARVRTIASLAAANMARMPADGAFDGAGAASHDSPAEELATLVPHLVDLSAPTMEGAATAVC